MFNIVIIGHVLGRAWSEIYRIRFLRRSPNISSKVFWKQVVFEADKGI